MAKNKNFSKSERDIKTAVCFCGINYLIPTTLNSLVFAVFQR